MGTKQDIHMKGIRTLMAREDLREMGISTLSADTYTRIFEYFIEKTEDLSDRCIDQFRNLIELLYRSANDDGACRVYRSGRL